MRIPFLSVLALPVLVLSAFTVAGCHPHRAANPAEMRKMVSWFINGVLDDIDANDSQRAVVREAESAVFERIQSHRASHLQAANELIAEWEKDNPDMDKVRRLIDAELEARRQSVLDSLADVTKVHDALTPAQRAQLASQLRERLAE